MSDKHIWPCGCVTWAEGKKFFVEACNNPNCSIINIVHEESKKKGNPVLHIKKEDYKK